VYPRRLVVLRVDAVTNVYAYGLARAWLGLRFERARAVSPPKAAAGTCECRCCVSPHRGKATVVLTGLPAPSLPLQGHTLHAGTVVPKQCELHSSARLIKIGWTIEHPRVCPKSKDHFCYQPARSAARPCKKLVLSVPRTVTTQCTAECGGTAGSRCASCNRHRPRSPCFDRSSGTSCEAGGV